MGCYISLILPQAISNVVIPFRVKLDNLRLGLLLLKSSMKIKGFLLLHLTEVQYRLYTFRQLFICMMQQIFFKYPSSLPPPSSFPLLPPLSSLTPLPWAMGIAGHDRRSSGQSDVDSGKRTGEKKIIAIPLKGTVS